MTKDLIVQTKYGMVQGIKENHSIVFKGIPFAKPPVGSLRFKEPQEPEAWSGILLADNFSDGCMQSRPPKDDFFEREFGNDEKYKVNFSEDSLYLNIWIPARKQEKKLPVAVWMYGGGLVSGHGAEKEFDGTEYTKRNVILVTFNYRVGLFGFMCHPWLAEENNGRCGNYGNFDQIAVLRWVHDNIEGFGGDAENVTLFGQSSGALTAQSLLLSPLSKGLIHKSILQSGAGYQNGFCKNWTKEYFYDLGEKAIEKLGVKNLEELRAVSAEKILEVSDEMIGYYMSQDKGMGYEPVIDDYLLLGDSEENQRLGKYPDIPYILGSVANDICTPDDETIPMQESQLHNGCVNWAKHQIELGRTPSYVYYFKRRLPGDEAGAFHSAELWYMFGTLSRGWRPFTEGDYELSEQMLDYWCNFMRTGNPNGEGVPDWNPWTEEGQEVMVFDVVKNGSFHADIYNS